MANMEQQGSQLPLTVLALVALVAVVGLVGLVMNATGAPHQVAAGSQTVPADGSENVAGGVMKAAWCKDGYACKAGDGTQGVCLSGNCVSQTNLCKNACEACTVHYGTWSWPGTCLNNVCRYGAPTSYGCGGTGTRSPV